MSCLQYQAVPVGAETHDEPRDLVAALDASGIERVEEIDHVVRRDDVADARDVLREDLRERDAHDLREDLPALEIQVVRNEMFEITHTKFRRLQGFQDRAACERETGGDPRPRDADRRLERVAGELRDADHAGVRKPERRLQAWPRESEQRHRVPHRAPRRLIVRHDDGARGERARVHDDVDSLEVEAAAALQISNRLDGHLLRRDPVRDANRIESQLRKFGCVADRLPGVDHLTDGLPRRWKVVAHGRNADRLRGVGWLDACRDGRHGHSSALELELRLDDAIVMAALAVRPRVKCPTSFPVEHAGWHRLDHLYATHATFLVQREARRHVTLVEARLPGKFGIDARDERGRRRLQRHERLARIDIEAMLAMAIGVHDLGAPRLRGDREEEIDIGFRANRQCHGKRGPAALYLAVDLRLLYEVVDCGCYDHYGYYS